MVPSSSSSSSSFAIILLERVSRGISIRSPLSFRPLKLLTLPPRPTLWRILLIGETVLITLLLLLLLMLLLLVLLTSLMIMLLLLLVLLFVLLLLMLLLLPLLRNEDRAGERGEGDGVSVSNWLARVSGMCSPLWDHTEGAVKETNQQKKQREASDN